MIKKVLIKDFEHFMDRRSFPLHPETNKYHVNNVFTMQGQEWREARVQLSPIFTTTRMKGIMPVVNEVSDSFVKYLNRPETNKEDLDAKNLTQLCTAEILSRIGCGVKPNILEDKDPDKNVFYQVCKKKTLAHRGFQYLFINFFRKLRHYFVKMWVP